MNGVCLFVFQKLQHTYNVDKCLRVTPKGMITSSPQLKTLICTKAQVCGKYVKHIPYWLYTNKPLKNKNVMRIS